jgi:hypothetical protein
MVANGGHDAAASKWAALRGFVKPFVNGSASPYTRSPTDEASLSMRSNGLLTRAEAILLVAGIMLIAGGAVWAAGIG